MMGFISAHDNSKHYFLCVWALKKFNFKSIITSCFIIVLLLFNILKPFKKFMQIRLPLPDQLIKKTALFAYCFGMV